RPIPHPPFPYTTLFRSDQGAPVELLRGDEELERLDFVQASVLLDVLHAQPSKAGLVLADRRVVHVEQLRDLLLGQLALQAQFAKDRKSTRLNSSHVKIS